jgi:hypothetical protein
MEFTWKDGGLNFLPEQGLFAAEGPVEIRKAGDALQVLGKGWTRTLRLDGAVLTVAQSPAVPPDTLKPAKRGNVSLTISRESPGRVKYALTR